MNETGKVIAVTSVKGGVGKTTTTLNLAGIYHLMGKKVLIIDLDLYAGGIATSLNLNNKKDLYTLTDALDNNRFTKLSDYVRTYNKGIDVIACPVDPRIANKIDVRSVFQVISLSRREYDIVLLDMHHILDEITLGSLDIADMCLYVITNDLIDIKNMKNIVNIFKETEKKNYKIVLNNSRDTGRDYISLFDIRTMTKANVDYTIPRTFYIKNIDKYVLNGDILTLNKSINRQYAKEIENLNKMALDLIGLKEGRKNG